METDEGREDKMEPAGPSWSMQANGYDLTLSRYDGLIQHSVCHLDLKSEEVLCPDAESAGILLETVPWQVTVGYNQEIWGPLPMIACAAISSMLPPGRPLIGFRLQGVEWPLAMALIDGYRRSGNLILHIMMRDAAGGEVDVQVPIYPDTFHVFDPTGEISERLLCNQTRRN